ncbi:MAG: AMP-binding protein, partial [Acidimicrobiia bacterium]
SVSVFPVEVVRFIEKHEISVWYSVPSILALVTEHAEMQVGDLPTLRTVLFAGEVFPTKHLSRIMRLLPHVTFANLYGPTETNVCTAFQVPTPPDEDAPPISIGAAISNVETFVVSSDGTEVEAGVAGELWVRGPTVMKGYWGDPDRTAEKLVPSPIDRHLGDLVYRTGDLVEEDPDGNYRFLGRRDNQIKSRGYRIELGDIETVVGQHPSVFECGVVAVPDEMISNRIECFVSTSGEVDEKELTRFCAESLPKYMIPGRFTVVDVLPKTSTGKIDRRSLQEQAEAVAG